MMTCLMTKKNMLISVQLFTAWVCEHTGCVIIIDAFQHIGKLQQYIRDFQ